MTTIQCEATVRVGDADMATCVGTLDASGRCPNSAHHLDYVVDGVPMTADEYYDLMEARERRTWGSD